MNPKDLLTLLTTAIVWPFVGEESRRTIQGLRAMLYLQWAMRADPELTVDAVIKGVVNNTFTAASTNPAPIPNVDLNA